MFNIFNDLFGLTYVEEDPESGLIIIGGIKTQQLLDDIKAIWGNIKVVSFIFTTIKKNQVSFYKFFAVDICYILQQIYLYKKRKSSQYRIKSAISQLKEKTWISRMDRHYDSIIDESQLVHSIYKPLAHQTDFFEIYSQKTQKMGLNGFLLSAGVGSGKSPMSLMLSVMLKCDCVILLAPKNLIYDVWVSSVKTAFGEHVSYWSSLDDKPLTRDYKYYICHYDALRKLVPLIDFFRSREQLMIVLDESHNFNDANSQRSKLFIDICRRTHCRHTILASGTPIKAIGMEAITLLKCIDPLFTPQVEERFRKIFGVSAKRAVDILRHRLDLISHKIPREAYMAHIPPPTITRVKVKIPDGHLYTVAKLKQEMRDYITEKIKFYSANMKKYNDIYHQSVEIYVRTIKTANERNEYNRYVQYFNMIKDGYDPKIHKNEAKFCNDFEKNRILPALKTSEQRKQFKEAKSIVKYIKLTVLGKALGEVLGKRRAECHKKMVRHSEALKYIEDAAKKTLCFTSFVEVLEEASSYFKENSLQPTLVYGGNKEDTGKLIEQFKADPNINPIIATYQSMSAGVTLVNCSTILMLNSPYREYLVTQSIARAFRIGQDTAVSVIEFILDTGHEYNISDRAHDIMEWSKTQVEEILGHTISSKEMDGIVQRLRLNPETSLDKALRLFRDLF